MRKGLRRFALVYKGPYSQTFYITRIGEVAKKREKTLMHFLWDGPDLAKARLRTLGKQYFPDLKEISDCRLGKLLFLGKRIDFEDLNQLDSASVVLPLLSSSMVPRWQDLQVRISMSRSSTKRIFNVSGFYDNQSKFGSLEIQVNIHVTFCINKTVSLISTM